MPAPEALLVKSRKKHEDPLRLTRHHHADHAAVPGVNILAVVENHLGVRIRLNQLCREDGRGRVGDGDGVAHDGVEVLCCELDIAAFRTVPSMQMLETLF